MFCFIESMMDEFVMQLKLKIDFIDCMNARCSLHMQTTFLLVFVLKSNILLN